MYRLYREIQNLDQNFSLKLLQNFSIYESSRMTPEMTYFPLCTVGYKYVMLDIFLSVTQFKPVSSQYFKCLKIEDLM